MTQHLSSLRKEQRRCLEAAANNPDGKIYAGPETPYKLTFCRALVRKGYFAGSLTTKGQQPFTITQEGRDALDPLHDYVTFSPQIEETSERDALIALIQSHLDDPNLLTYPATSDHQRRLAWLLHERQQFQKDAQGARAEINRLRAGIQSVIIQCPETEPSPHEAGYALKYTLYAIGIYLKELLK